MAWLARLGWLACVTVGLGMGGGALTGCAQGSADIDETVEDDGPSSGGAGGSSAGGSSAGGSSTGGSATGGSSTGGSSTGGSSTGGSATGGMGGAPGPNCGNGVVETGEDCDDTDLDSKSCADFSHDSGQLACNGNCTFNTSDCYTCGDGNLHGPEVCDGANLNSQTCQTLMYDDGTLLCAANCLSFNETSCTDCGDSSVDGSEECDMLNLDGEMCSTLGYAGGTLTCNGDCTFNETQCVAYACSDSTDNDADGFTDLADPGCSSFDDDDETIFAPNCGGVGGPIYDVTYANTNLDVVVTGATGGANNFNCPLYGDCISSTGPEVILHYRVFTQMDVEFYFNTLTTNFDTVLYIKQTDCVTPLAEVCNDDDILSLTSYLNVTMPPGDYYIFIDGYAGASGNYELIIDLPN